MKQYGDRDVAEGRIGVPSCNFRQTYFFPITIHHTQAVIIANP
jgi:hypothetical protein